MPHWRRSRTALLRSCCAVYGSSPRICTSWQSLIRQNKTSGASCGKYTLLNNISFCNKATGVLAVHMCLWFGQKSLVPTLPDSVVVEEVVYSSAYIRVRQPVIARTAETWVNRWLSCAINYKRYIERWLACQIEDWCCCIVDKWHRRWIIYCQWFWVNREPEWCSRKEGMHALVMINPAHPKMLLWGQLMRCKARWMWRLKLCKYVIFGCGVIKGGFATSAATSSYVIKVSILLLGCTHRGVSRFFCIH